MLYRNLIFSLILIMCAGACGKRNAEREIEQAMKIYDGLILRVDGDSIANTFVEHGEMGEVGKTRVVGRDSIRKLLKTFSHFHVLESNSVTRAIKIEGDTARQEGTFTQVVVVGKDTVHASGQYFAIWVQEGSHHWLLKSMKTKSN